MLAGLQDTTSWLLNFPQSEFLLMHTHHSLEEEGLIAILERVTLKTKRYRYATGNMWQQL